MGYNPIIIKNEKLAPKLAKKVLQLISGLLFLAGKPLFIFFLLILTLILNFLNITGHLFNNIFGAIKKVDYLKNASKIRKKSGVIFSASREHIKTRLRHFRNRFEILRKQGNKKFENYSEKGKNLLWNAEVFLIALEKLLSRFFLLAKSRFQPKKAIRLYFLRLKLSLLTLNKHLPRLKFPKFSLLRVLGVLTTLTFLAGFAGGVAFWHFILRDLPSPQELPSRKQKVSTKIYDRHGTLLYNIYKDQNRTPVALNNIPVHVKSATIAIEDAEFYSHPGFSVRGIARALIKNYKDNKLSGGSTITQQLVKNTLLSPEKTYIRKLKEVTLAIQVELAFGKDEILEMYLNEVSYGGTAYGVQEASRTYFGKDVKNLSLAEAALLAGLPKSPTEYSPFGTNPDLALSRQKEVLNLMEINGFITSEQRKTAESEIIKYADQKTDIKAPHFVMWVRQILEDKYGKSVIDSGGLEITTSLDFSIQTMAEKVVGEELEKLAKLNVTNAAVLVLNPKTGEVLAMVGSKDYFDTQNDGNVNVTIRPRQPGSSIKVVNYAYALSNGMNAASIISDTPVTFLVDDQPPYTPKNYEGNYKGNLTLRSALAESRNIPAVRILASYGVEEMVDLGQKMGITTWQDTSNYGLSLTLGGGEVRLLDLAQVYATIANYGKRPEIASVLKISDIGGNLVEEFSCKTDNSLIAKASASESALNPKSSETNCTEEQVIDPRVAYLITDILKDNAARSPTFGTNSLMIIPGHDKVAVKTGTSNNLRDNLTIGYNQDYLVAVWVGNNDNSSMSRIASGVTGATPIWNKIMTALLAGSEKNDWTVPEKLVKTSICPFTGTLSCRGCSGKSEWFLEENKPMTACNPDWFLAKEENNDSGSESRDLSNEEQDQKDPSEEEDTNIRPEIIEVKEKNLPAGVNKKKNTLGRN